MSAERRGDAPRGGHPRGGPPRDGSRGDPAAAPDGLPPDQPLLAFDDVDLRIGESEILRGIDFSVRAGTTLGIVGESGSGKSMTALSVMRLLPRGAALSGSIRFGGRDLARLDERELQRVRGREIGMVFQEPMTALNPLKTIGSQVTESIRLHGAREGGEKRGALTREEAETRARRTLERVGLPAARVSPDRYPHELSGGQRQRVVIAIAIACRPRLLIADEPTTALDVTTQAAILDLLRELREEEELALVLISHDLAVVAGMADELLVMKGGEIVDAGSFGTVFSTRSAPYARSLLEATAWHPSGDGRRAKGGELLVVDDLVVGYPSGPRRLFGARERHLAVDGVSLRVGAGESVGLVGESGCGKSTLARALLGLTSIDAGLIRFRGETMVGNEAKGVVVPRALRREVQVVFQDPYGSFDPRQRVERLVAEPLHLLESKPDRVERRAIVAAMLARVGIGREALDRYIHEFSGGQRQRIAIARALVIEPSLVVLDEAVSALDVSVRAQVLALLDELAADEGLAYLFISHDLSVVRSVTDRVLVMRDGRIVEEGDSERVFTEPAHPYTRELLSAVPRLPALGDAGEGDGSRHPLARR